MSQKISEYGSKGDSVSLTKIGDQKFTIKAVEDSPYDDQAGVKITTLERFDVDGTKQNKFHTTRTAIVTKLTNQKLRDDLKDGKSIGPVKCIEVKSKAGRNYFDLEDA